MTEVEVLRGRVARLERLVSNLELERRVLLRYLDEARRELQGLRGAAKRWNP